MGNPVKNAQGGILRWNGRLGLGIILLFALAALAAPLLAPPGPTDTGAAFRWVQVPAGRSPNPPGAEFRLGTVPAGRSDQQLDIYYTLIWGARAALTFGFGATLVVSVFGSLVGATSSFVGGTAGRAILYVTVAFLAFPVIAGIVFFGQLMFPDSTAAHPSLLRAGLLRLGVDNVMLALILLGWMPYARVIYANMERIRRLDFVVAAQAAGAKPGRIILRHLIPNAISNVVVLATRDVSGLVLMQAAFSFLGLGGNSYWGELLMIGRHWILGTGGNPLKNWWVFVPVTAALVLFGIGWNLFGDFLNEYLNPRLRYSEPE